MSKTGCTVIGVHHTRKTDSENRRDNESLDLADVSEWFQQARGPRVLINGSDVRLGIDKPAKSHITGDDGEIVLRGFERVRGEIPAFEAQAQAGHSRPGMTSDYTIVGLERREQAVRRVQERLLGDTVSKAVN